MLVTRGLVAVNPSAGPATIHLHHPYLLATLSGGGDVPDDGQAPPGHVAYTRMTSLTVSPGDAAILLSAASTGAR